MLLQRCTGSNKHLQTRNIAIKAGMQEEQVEKNTLGPGHVLLAAQQWLSWAYLLIELGELILQLFQLLAVGLSLLLLPLSQAQSLFKLPEPVPQPLLKSL